MVYVCIKSVVWGIEVKYKYKKHKHVCGVNVKQYQRKAKLLNYTASMKVIRIPYAEYNLTRTCWADKINSEKK